MNTSGEDGYELWLRYRAVGDAARLAQYRQAINSATVLGTGATAEIIRRELARALPARRHHWSITKKWARKDS